MTFEVTTRTGTAGDKSGTVYTLGNDAARIEVWPFLGFNCLRWQVRDANGGWGDLLYVAPDWEQNPVPTRSGHPVLFPFPNRLAHGRFTFEGKTYQLPLNDATGTHAIHGFTPRNPWRVVDVQTEQERAEITGEFQLSRDLPDALAHWPTDFVLKLCYRLVENALRVDAIVENPSPRPLPFGLGYHPYFCVPGAPGASVDEFILRCSAKTLWEAEEAIPTGRRLPLPMALDFLKAKPIGDMQLDTLFADVFGKSEFTRESVAELGHVSTPGRLVVECSYPLRELLLFTPPHRKALAIEPYTCATDAPNLAARGIDAGWRILKPGERFGAVVTYRWEPGVRL